VGSSHDEHARCLCATAGAKLSGASLIIGVDRIESRLEMARKMGADVVINSAEQDVPRGM